MRLFYLYSQIAAIIWMIKKLYHSIFSFLTKNYNSFRFISFRLALHLLDETSTLFRYKSKLIIFIYCFNLQCYIIWTLNCWIMLITISQCNENETFDILNFMNFLKLHLNILLLFKERESDLKITNIWRTWKCSFLS